MLYGLATMITGTGRAVRGRMTSAATRAVPVSTQAVCRTASA
ncbi:hypothetical protein ACFQV2_33760 [Actinokineospora soli]|uniref:Uncharacterized protein n=1 Tax=Actinokineospora soli TaxID=1048753 RepID=A0ABW2TY46_9PSEU